MQETPNLTPARRAEQVARDRRLAEALRANLQRRKAQARARDGKAPILGDEAVPQKPRG